MLGLQSSNHKVVSSFDYTIQSPSDAINHKTELNSLPSAINRQEPRG